MGLGRFLLHTSLCTDKLASTCVASVSNNPRVKELLKSSHKVAENLCFCVFQASLFMEEMASIVLTPFVLYFSLPYCTHAILDFVRDNTVFVEGVGDICSLANFDFEKHGNSKYGALTHCPKVTLNMLLLP